MKSLKISQFKAVGQEVHRWITNPFAAPIGGICMTLASMYFTGSALVPFLCLVLLFLVWALLRDLSIGMSNKIALIFFGSAAFLFIIVCPNIQNKIDPPNLSASGLVNRADAKHLILITENTGDSDYSGGQTFYFGLVELFGDKKITWIPASRAARVGKGRRVAFRFNRPDSVKKHAFSVIAIKDKKLPGNYVLEPFYTADGGEKWFPYYDYIGFVDTNDGLAMDDLIFKLSECIQKRNIEKCSELK